MNGNTVIIVDTRDSAYIRDLRKTYSIEVAESVSAAIEKIERSSFDVAIINNDIVGLNLLPTIRGLCPETVFIAISSEGSMRRVVEVMRMGFYDYIFHPFPSDYLITSIKDGVRAEHIRREKTKDIATIASQKGSVQAIIQSMPDGLIVTDRNQNVAFRSSRAAELLPIESVWDKKVWMGKGELELETPAGTVLIRTNPLRGSGDALQGWVSVVTDITKLGKSSQLMSEAALRCTHEIRAPLGAIRNYLTVLLDGTVGNLNDKQRFMLTRMMMRADALLELERDLLDLSTIESGSSTLEKEPLSLADSIREVTDMMRPSAAEKGVRMRFLVEPDPLVTRADSKAIKRIFTNLVSNAIKYTPSGGIVQVRVGRNDGRAFVEVMDTGIGISAENLSRIFDKFFRVRDRQTAEIVGTGLGLPIVKALVDAHSGEIKVDSAVGRGSTFTVFLPVARTSVVHERESKVL